MAHFFPIGFLAPRRPGFDRAYLQFEFEVPGAELLKPKAQLGLVDLLQRMIGADNASYILPALRPLVGRVENGRHLSIVRGCNIQISRRCSLTASNRQERH